MKTAVLFCLALLLRIGPACSQTSGQLNLPEFAALAEKAAETVSVTLDANLLGMAARFLDSTDPEQAQARKIVAALSGIYVRCYKFDRDFAYPTSELDALRRQLAKPGWNRIVETRSKKEKTDVDVYILTANGKARGLAIIASEPREFTIVNIVGNIDLDQLHDLEGTFGVPALGIEAGGKPVRK